MNNYGNEEFEFVQLTTVQGVRPSDLIDGLNGRTLVIWGCGHLGRVLAGVFRRFASRDFQMGFCDKRAALWGTTIDDTPVLRPADCTARIAHGRAFGVVAVAAGGDGIAATLANQGATPIRDFVIYRHISRPEVHVKVAAMADGGMRYLDTTAFAACVDKLLREIPHVMQLSLTGDPDALAHPELPRLVATTRGRVATSLTGRLHAADLEHVSRVVEAGPNLVALRTALPGEKADITSLRGVLEALRQLRERFGDRTEFRILYVKRRAAQDGETRAILGRLCEETSLPLVETEGYVEPYDLLLSRQFGSGAMDELTAQQMELTWDLKAALQCVMNERGRPCLSQRVFPVIGPDLTVNACHLYRTGRLEGSFLAKSYDELVSLRHESDLCRECQSQGLHRLDIDVLRRRHPEVSFDREG